MESLKALEAEKSGMGGGIGKQGAAAHQAKKDMAQAQAGEAAATRQAERLMEEWRELFTQSHACRGAAELAFAVLTLTLTPTLTLTLTNPNPNPYPNQPAIKRFAVVLRTPIYPNPNP